MGWGGEGEVLSGSPAPWGAGHGVYVPAGLLEHFQGSFLFPLGLFGLSFPPAFEALEPEQRSRVGPAQPGGLDRGLQR